MCKCSWPRDHVRDRGNYCCVRVSRSHHWWKLCKFSALWVVITHLYTVSRSKVKKTLCLTSTETIRLIRNGEKGGRGYGGGGRGRLYTCRYAAVTTRMTSALRWAGMRAILMFHNCEGQSHKTLDSVHRPQFFKRKKSRSRFEPRSFCLPA